MNHEESKMTEAENAVASGDWCGADPFEPSFRDDPYPALHGLRSRDPVNLTPVGTWRISRYDDVAKIFRQAKTSMTLSNGESPNFDPLDKRGSFLEFMLNKDDPEHLRLRRLAMLTLNPKTARLMEDEVRLTVTDAMDAALLRGGMDIVPHMAHNVPSRMVCKIMGIPESDRHAFNEWTAFPGTSRSSGTHRRTYVPSGSNFSPCVIGLKTRKKGEASVPDPAVHCHPC